jgi:hypothetical protein
MMLSLYTNIFVPLIDQDDPRQASLDEERLLQQTTEAGERVSSAT